MKEMEFSGKTVDDALTEALVQLGLTSDQIEYDIIDKGSTGFLGFNAKEAQIRVRIKSTPQDRVREFLDQVFAAMHMEVDIEFRKSDEEKTISVNLAGADMGVLIGKRGQTLDALQYLTNLAVNKDTQEYIRIKMDTENYRERRKETLENLARNLAYKVKRTKKPMKLEPMNPFERRVIHCALQGDRYVETHSEGEEPYRYVVITLKK